MESFPGCWLCCQYDARAFLHAQTGRSQCEDSAPFVTALERICVWGSDMGLAGSSITQGVVVLLGHVAGNSNGREQCKSSGEVPAAMSQAPLLIPPNVPTAWSSSTPVSPACCSDPGSWALKGKWHELYVYSIPNTSKTWLSALEAWNNFLRMWCLAALMLERRLSI